MTCLYALALTLFLGMTLAALWHARWVRRLPSMDSLVERSSPPHADPRLIRCSVVIAARDEEARIEQTVRHALAQRGVEVEVLVVDDRSTDRTSEILKRMAARDPRVRVIQVTELPDGWLGKCHACHLGAQAATKDWILFTDADCWLQQDVILRAARVAERERADHLTLTPGTAVESVWARAWHLLFLTSVLNWISGVNRDRPKAFFGIGAFNLVRATAYRQCGGFAALRLTVLDDIKLGLLLRRAGTRTRAYLGVDDVECHWGTTVRGMIKIMEKNYFAVTEYRTWLVALGLTWALGVTAILIAGIASGTLLGIAAGLSPFTLAVPGAVVANRLGWARLSGVSMPLMIPVFLYALFNSTWVTLRQGGVRWRDTFYPLDVLRAGNVR